MELSRQNRGQWSRELIAVNVLVSTFNEPGDKDILDFFFLLVSVKLSPEPP